MKTVRDLPRLADERFDGHARQFRKVRSEIFVRLHEECGDLAAMRLFNLLFVSVGSPELAHELFVEKARSFEKTLAIKMAFQPLTGKSLFTTDGEVWKRQRKLMAPLFHPAAVRSYADMMNEVIERSLGAWKDGDIIDASREMTRITMAVAGKALFDSDSFDDADELGAAIQVMFGHVTEQAGSISLLARTMVGAKLLDLGPLPPWGEKLRERAVEGLGEPIPWPTAKARRHKAAVRVLNEKIQSLIAERRQVGDSRRDVLSQLLAARDEDDGSGMTDKQVRDEAVTLFVAGHETTATGTTWSLYFLARDPEVYSRWQDEARALDGKTPVADDASRLPYTLGIFKEALRVYPPALMLDRFSTEDVELGGTLIPRGTVVVLCPYALHRRSSLWPDPERFDPERFLPEAEAKRHRFAWLPFGAGPRVCIGAQFANLEAQLLLAQIAQRFDLEILSREPVGMDLMTAARPVKPVLMRVRHKSISRAVPREPAAKSA